MGAADPPALCGWDSAHRANPAVSSLRRDQTDPPDDRDDHARPDGAKLRASCAPDPWFRPLSELLVDFRSSPDGLSADEAARRLVSQGPNLLEEPRRQHLLFAFLRRFGNPLVLVLLFAALTAALTNERASFLIIATIVFLSVLIDFVQEHRAEKAADALRQRVALSVRVVRQGQTKEVPAADLVTGDIVLLAAGNLVPADCRLVEARDLFVNEALLTGESFPVEKDAGDAPDTLTSTSTLENGVFMGSSVVSGTARALVVATGRATRLGAIAGALNREPSPTAFTLGIRSFGMLIVRLTVLLVLFVLLVNLLFHRPLMESFLFALALAVGLTPELLPMVVSVTLARGAIRMANKQVIVKRLSAIQDLGAMDVLCSDKTGTLTESRIKLVRRVDIAGNESGDVLQWAYVNAGFETGLKSPLDDAILASAPIDLAAWRKIDEVPFDFERRRVSVLAERDGRRFLIVKGAPEDVIGHSSSYALAGGDATRPLDETARTTALATLRQLGDEGFRVLGVAWREVEVSRDHAGIADESELTFAGFAVFLDPPKESARAALEALYALGVAVKIVTGDNERVTRHVCESLGIPMGSILNGPDLAKLSDEALSARLAGTTLFCRVTPPQKARVIAELRRRGNVVGYLGDGINDAPSLRAADVGLSVEGAVDVAREAAAMILLKHDLGVVAGGVREGRRTFANIMKYVMMGTSSNFGNMFSMAGAVLVLPFLPMQPVQILLNNLLYDTSEIAIPLDRVDDDMISKPRHWDMNFIQNFMLVLGPVSSLFDFATFALLLWVFNASEALFQTGWFVESLATQVLVIFVIRTSARPWLSRPHPALAASSLGIVALALALPFTPLGAWFGFVPVPAHVLLTLAAVTAFYLVVAEQVKHWFFLRAHVVREQGGRLHQHRQA
ncbi:magnesium-translocating P-type ATPase [Pseudaminobacter sp. 19-2017]|uniref:Magnesium-transporting ATPase, P-type 1 n=1 Tax=Pseudaminobacter soli (ex Zhang et al. 2022) TaxID=2831468 RepID=A0A942E6V9_9HYPH|nr:magnesium-translocating P-type ATPase [Pseudaminobacter soli]MBS3651585.1 magnesium-translocating P-type ATPase [Pseudaminobacter soli]